MATRRVGLRDVAQGAPSSGLKLLAPLRYLAISNPQKDSYDLLVPVALGAVAWLAYLFLEPKPAIFGENGLLQFSQQLLVMAVPFMIGALAAVAMGASGPHLDRRPAGVELFLDGELLTLRQFVCYLLGYLSFVGVVTLAAVVIAQLMRDPVMNWIEHSARMMWIVSNVGVLVLLMLLSFLTIAVLWALYFLTVIVNRRD